MKGEIWVVDIECDGLINEVTRIHCLVGYGIKSKKTVEITDYEEMKAFITANPDDIFVGHNFIGYDNPVLQKILGVGVAGKIIDTLGISWYLNSSNGRPKHGLESYGDEYETPKVHITADQWNGDMDDPEFKSLMLARCSRDVVINTRLWLEQQQQLMEIYEKDIPSIHKVIDYIMFKMDCLREQEAEGLELDVEYCLNSIEELSALVEPKEKALIEAMPKIPISTIRKKPKVMVKADGTPSALGEKWKKTLVENNFPEDSDVEEIEVITGYEDGNPSSSLQIKDWLYSLGWIPENIKYVRDKKTNTVKQIPQIKHATEEGDICDSIKKLYSKEPALENLGSLSVIKSRMNDLKGFIRDNYYGKLYPSAQGFTNTFRLKHRVIVNLPKHSVLYGEYARRAIVAKEGSLLCGSDLSSVEDNSKQHYIYPYDPDYVNDMRTDGFDPHISIAVLAKLITEAEQEFYKWYDSKKDDSKFNPSQYYRELSDEDQKKEFSRLKEERQKAKTVNFSCTYGAGVETIARNSQLPLKVAKHLHKVYWERNKSITQFSRDQKTKTINGQMWVFNPVSGFWLTLRTQKDIFSSVNQSTAVYIMDKWLMGIRKRGIIVAFQYHDEFVCNLSEGGEDRVTNIVNEAMKEVNEELNLNVPLGCSIEFGKTYIDIH